VWNDLSKVLSQAVPCKNGAAVLPSGVLSRFLPLPSYTIGLGNFAVVTWTSLAVRRKERGCLVRWGSSY
jgi:hypothetical protein